MPLAGDGSSMGYVCPVCEDPQADGEHLANHLAFTALLGDDAHEAWLDDHAPGWGDCDPTSLAERVVDDVEEGEFPQVFEDTTGRVDNSLPDHSHAGHGHAGDAHDEDPGDADLPGDASALSDLLAEARELTRRRRAADGAGDAGADDTAETDDGGTTGDGTPADGANETGSS
jgi:hypothetical protein